MNNKQKIDKDPRQQDHVNVHQPDHLVALLKQQAASAGPKSLGGRPSLSQLLQDLPTAPILTPECDH